MGDDESHAPGGTRASRAGEAFQTRVCEGRVRHRRFGPVAHGFSYSIYMTLLDLEEVERGEPFGTSRLCSATRPAPIRWRRADHFGDPSRSLAACVRDAVEERTGVRPEGPIRLLTNLRHFGYVFNPISVYYCFAPAGDRLEAVLAEVTNTPWGERTLYALAAKDAVAATPRALRFETAKEMHVSPFMGMDMRYRWRVGVPGETLSIHLENVLPDGRTIFDAALTLRVLPANASTPRRILLRHPFMTWKAIAAIHFEALRLWLKGVPFRTHPKKLVPKAKEA